MSQAPPLRPHAVGPQPQAGRPTQQASVDALRHEKAGHGQKLTSATMERAQFRAPPWYGRDPAASSRLAIPAAPPEPRRPADAAAAAATKPPPLLALPAAKSSTHVA